MPTIACKSELCAEDQHEAATPEEMQHRRLVTDEDADYRVVATWTGTLYDVTTAHVELTHHETTMTLTPSETLFWVQVLTAGGVFFTPADGPASSSEIAADLATAAEVLYYVNPDRIPEQEFTSRNIEMIVQRAIGAFFPDDEDEDEPAHVGGDR